jgi:hypothetical protein
LVLKYSIVAAASDPGSPARIAATRSFTLRSSDSCAGSGCDMTMYFMASRA